MCGLASDQVCSNNDPLDLSYEIYEIDFQLCVLELFKGDLDYEDRYYSPVKAEEYTKELIKIKHEILNSQDPFLLTSLVKIESILIKRLSYCVMNQRTLICKEIVRIKQRIHHLSFY